MITYNKTISVIIPVYNGEKYLNKCIDSIIGQTYKQLEIIIVDDGSTDHSGEISDNYAMSDNRVVVLHGKNAGLVEARKKGVNYAHSEYISFVDADDWIDEDMYECLAQCLSDYQCDMVASAIFRQFDDKMVLNINTVESGYYDKKDIEQKIYPFMLCNGSFYKMGIRPNIYGKIFLKDKIKNIQTDAPVNVTNGEDVMITYPYMLLCNSIYVTNNSWYHYRQYSNSMSQTIARENENGQIHSLINFLKEKFIKLGTEEWRLFSQLEMYLANLLIQRNIGAFDDFPGQLRIFGNIRAEEKIIVYGAGKLGKQVYNYSIRMRKEVGWCDKNCEIYREQGLPVDSIDYIDLGKNYKIVIAVVDSEMSNQIKNELVSKGIPREKIMGLDIDYISSKKTLSKLGFNL